MARRRRIHWRRVMLSVLAVAGMLAWQWFHGQSVGPTKAQPDDVMTVVRAHPLPDKARLPEPVMDVVGPARAGAASETEAPAASDPALVLRGIFATRDEAYGIALIQHPDGRERHFYRGDEVFGMARLEAIRVDHVLLLRDGQYHVLYLSERSPGGGLEAQLARKRGETFARLRKDFLSGNIMNLVHLVGADTAYDERGFIGFRLVALSDEGRRLLEELGLADGDIVSHIDGQEIAQSIQSVRQAVAMLRDAPLTTVTIVRQGRPLEIPLQMPDPGTSREAADS